MEDVVNKRYKICDGNRDKMKAVVATSLEDLLTKVPDELGLPSENLTVVLESDGTEVDDEEYFSTLHPDTSLMILHGAEKWGPYIPECKVSSDETDDIESQVVNLVSRLKHNLYHISLLGDDELELLSDMDPDSLTDIITDKDKRINLEHIKEASGRILLEKRRAQDAMELLKLYHQSVANGSEDVPPPAYEASKGASPRAQTPMEVVQQDVQRALLRHHQYQRAKLRHNRRTNSISNPLFRRTDSTQQDSYVARTNSKLSWEKSKSRRRAFTSFWQK